MKTFFRTICLIALLAGLSGCSKDDELMSQKVQVTFVKDPVSVSIYPAENEDLKIMEKEPDALSGKITFRLNIGNYLLKPNNAGTVAFQVTHGKNTHIHFTIDRVPVVSYK